MTEFLDIVKGSLDSVIGVLFFNISFINTNAILYLNHKKSMEESFINSM